MMRDARQRRSRWAAKIEGLRGPFSDASRKLLGDLRSEIEKDGVVALVDHLRLCGVVPERYGRDSSEEKLYSKYTDAVVSESLTAVGLAGVVLSSRGDAADVEARGGGYSLVADAKAFRLSRTAKNQKDFKIQALDVWRRELDFAVLVCPIHQLPGRTSQIYQQAVAWNVCILSYAHLAALVGLADRRNAETAAAGLRVVLERVALMHPSKSAADYWAGINKALVTVLGDDVDLWTVEKRASLAGLAAAREEALAYLQGERDRLLRLSHQQALEELVRAKGVDSRIAQVLRAEHGGLLGD